MKTKQETIFTLNNQSILKTGEVLCLTGVTGVGKTTICELFLSQYYSSQKDCHLQCVSKKERYCLYINTHQTLDRIETKMEDISRYNNIQDYELRNIVQMKSTCGTGLLTIDRLNDYVTLYDPRLLILDQIEDCFTYGSITTEGSTLIVNELQKLLASHNCSLIYTLHRYLEKNMKKWYTSPELFDYPHTVIDISNPHKDNNRTLQIIKPFNENEFTNSPTSKDKTVLSWNNTYRMFL